MTNEEMQIIEQLQQKIHILYVFNLILNNFEMYEEAEFILDKLAEREKKLDATIDKLNGMD